ncbi:MAG TPA: hypothetical protein VMS64_40270 [Candidatus Methylomirabilis sp.]|nr:hypothetical protein [Candidatus Methylomirabilis sp.]
MRATRDGALRWLVESAIRTPDGGYHSTFDPGCGEYAAWYGGETSLVCTAGAVLALDRAGHHELALRSAEHICELAIEEDGAWRGALRAGLGSDDVVANHALAAVLALLQAFERSGNARFLEVATAAADFVIDRMQREDGSIITALCRDPHRRLRGPQETWPAHCIEGFVRLSEATGETRWRSGAIRAADWLLRLQRADGSFPLEVPGRLPWLASARRWRDPFERVRGDGRAHPVIQSYAVKGLMMLDRLPEARRAAEWLSRRLGPNGLFHQFYFPDGRFSVEEDVMPTAHFGLLLLEYPEIDVPPDLLTRIVRGMCYARIPDGEPGATGALRGLPRHPQLGGHAYSWDTAFGFLFLQDLLERARPSHAPE